MVSAPALGRRWWAAQGRRRLDREEPDQGHRLPGVRRSRLADASLSYSDLAGWEEQGRMAGFLGLARSVWRTRAYGDFWSHVLVAEGAVDISAEPEVSLWDLAALQIIVEEAGGSFTDLAGKPTPDGGSVVCTNGAPAQRGAQPAGPPHTELVAGRPCSRPPDHRCWTEGITCSQAAASCGGPTQGLPRGTRERDMKVRDGMTRWS